jgi:hypothetical protein
MTPQGRQRAKRGHEEQDADAVGVALIALLVLLIVAISLLTVRGVIRYAGNGEKPARATGKSRAFPEPRLEVRPVANYQEAAAAKELHSYGWVDRKHGLAHIPIERAMEMLQQRGLPEVGAGKTRLDLMQARPLTNSRTPQGVVAP